MIDHSDDIMIKGHHDVVDPIMTVVTIMTITTIMTVMIVLVKTM
jgi:hypothetical protein